MAGCWTTVLPSTEQIVVEPISSVLFPQSACHNDPEAPVAAGDTTVASVVNPVTSCISYIITQAMLNKVVDI